MHLLFFIFVPFVESMPGYSFFPFTSYTNRHAFVISFFVPFVESMPGYAGFDPLTLSEQWMDVDWSQSVVPGGGVPIFGQRPEYGSAAFPEAGFTTPVRTPAWMQEAEIKHGRIAMLAVVGWVAVDIGVRMPGSGYESIANSLVAHAAAVENGSLSWLAVIAAAVELVNGKRIKRFIVIFIHLISTCFAPSMSYNRCIYLRTRKRFWPYPW